MNLDSVFRIAEQQNAKIAAEREKLNQTQLEAELAAKGWIPQVTAGMGYYRHEGGIQLENGKQFSPASAPSTPASICTPISTFTRRRSSASMPSASSGSRKAS